MSDEFSAKEYFDDGENWGSHIARLALPVILWAAKNGSTITYKQLAEELNARHGEEIKTRMTLYGWPVGKIGHMMEKLSDEWGVEVPPVNGIVVNQQTHLPGDGVDGFIKRYFKKHYKKNMTKANRNGMAEEVMEFVWDYIYWDKVALYFGFKQLKPVSVLVDADKDDPIKLPRMPKVAGGYPESPQHKSLKKWAANNPKFFSRYGKFPKGKNEYNLSSGDSLDVYLKNDVSCLAIEVKGSNVSEAEIFRGIFQCVKYRVTLRAMQLASNEPTNAQSVLLTSA